MPLPAMAEPPTVPLARVVKAMEWPATEMLPCCTECQAANASAPGRQSAAARNNRRMVTAGSPRL